MDIAQDTFLKLFSSMAEFRGDASFSTWVYRLVVNSCLDHKRRSWRLIPMAGEVMAVLRAPGDALHGLLRSEMSGRVQGAVEKLPPTNALWWCCAIPRGWPTRKLPTCWAAPSEPLRRDSIAPIKRWGGGCRI